MILILKHHVLIFCYHRYHRDDPSEVIQIKKAMITSVAGKIKALPETKNNMSYKVEEVGIAGPHTSIYTVTRISNNSALYSKVFCEIPCVTFVYFQYYIRSC